MVDELRCRGFSEAVGRVGNPNVGGDILGCGPEVHVDLGDVYRTVDPWPTPLGEDVSATRDLGPEAAEFTVRVMVCVPVRDDQGRAPDESRRRSSVEDVAEIPVALIAALWGGVAEWRRTLGRVFVDRVSPEPKEGRFAAWSVRVIVPVGCLTDDACVGA